MISEQLTYEQKGMLEEGIIQFSKAKDANTDSTEPLELLGHVFAIAGQKDEAQMVLSELHSSAKQHGIHPYNVALIHSALGQRGKRLSGWKSRTLIGPSD